MKKVIKLENLDCANCGMLLERTVAKVDGVNYGKGGNPYLPSKSAKYCLNYNYCKKSH